MTRRIISYPDQLSIRPLKHTFSAVPVVPGSKSITNRALVLAAISSTTGPCRLIGPSHCEDTDVMIACLRQLGIETEADWRVSPPVIVVRGRDPSADFIPAESADLFVANSGTTIRFLTAVASLGKGVYRFDGDPRMRERPMGELLDALGQLGVQAVSESGTGSPPIRVEGVGVNRWAGGRVQVRGDVSSQVLSGLMMAGPFGTDEGVEIHVVPPLVSKPYLDMTVRMMKQWGFAVRHKAEHLFRVIGGCYCDFRSPAEYRIEPDASSASYFFAAAAITGGTAGIPGLGPESLQGDVAFVELLAKMGCHVDWLPGVALIRGAPLHGIDADMNAISDTAMTLAAVACFAEGPTRIRNVAHIRHKESDRIHAMATELRRVGAEVVELDDGWEITPRPLHGAEIETYNDHRIAMSMALVGLKVPGVVIKNPGCVAKTYPRFFEDLSSLAGSRT